MILFSGLSNFPLAQNIASLLHLQLSKSKTLVFANGELKPVIEEDVRGKTAVIIQSTSKSPNDSWMELFLMADALRRERAEKIVAVIPCFGYARQNQQHQKGEPVSAHVMVKFLEGVGISEIITVDLHDETMTGMFNIPITNLSALPLLAQKIKSDLTGDYTVVSPDQGGIERARVFANSLGCSTSPVIVEKSRDLDNIHQSHALQVVGNVQNLTAVIQDDIITTGGTVLHTIDAISKNGARDIFVCVTHEDFAGDCADRLSKSKLKKMLVTNSTQIAKSNMFTKLEVIDIAGLIADELRKL